MVSKIWSRVRHMGRRKLAVVIGGTLAILIFAPIYPAILPSGAYVTSVNGFASLSFLLSKQGFVIMGGHIYWGIPPFP